MKKFILLYYIFIMSSNMLYSNQKNAVVNYYMRIFNNSLHLHGSESKFSFSFISYGSYDLVNESQKEKNKIFDKPDYSWIKEKGRMEKIFIASGAVSVVIGFGLFLAGLINLLVPFNAVSIEGEPIITARNTYISLIGVGGGLMVTGIPFIIVGVIRLGKLKKAQSNNSQNEDSENNAEQ